MIEFSINNQSITRNDDFDVVADSKNYLLAKFTCSDEWKEKVTAIFGWGGKYFNVIIEDGVCMVPWEVIKAPFFTVSAICGDRITANEITVAVEESGYVEGETPKPPTPDVYAQLLNSVKPPYIGENGNWFLWDSDAKAFVDSGVKAKGYTPVKGVDYWAEEDKKEIIDNVKDEVEIQIETHPLANIAFYFAQHNNKEARLSVAENIEFTFGNGEYPETYMSGLSFDSGETPTSLNYTDSGILNWVGTDCTTVDGLSIFQPSANTHYDIVFYFNGTQFIGLVNGFVPSVSR